ncbi:MarR family transcriptional regulator [Citromicrobium bathyomarinum]|uniref:MarR family winged helix-turn-helix transcriptional regulator n=1 Tax=Citromicrobium bathyomarinum TaxID=72174 RepID=UPI00315A3C16
MFFLKELPSRQMVEGYASRLEDFDADEVLRALRIMRDGSLLIRELEAYFARHELSQLRFLAMIVIDREPDRDSLTAGEIAERLDVSRPVVTRTLQGLVKAGLIAISSNAHDARARDVALTPAGHATLDEVLPGYFAILHDTMKGIRA